MSSRSSLAFVVLGGLLAGMLRPCCAQTTQATKVIASDKTALLLFRDAESLPPEFAADIVLQVVENDASLPASQKIKALKTAFDEASHSPDDVLLRPWGGSVEETAEGLHAIALSVGRLDRISQQSSAVQDMAVIDPKLARARLAMISMPRLDPPACQATWVYLPDPYYEAVAKVMETGFSREEVVSGERGEFLRSVVNKVVSHSQLPPVTRLVRTSDVSGTELSSVISSYVYALDNLRGDAHSFNGTSQQSVDEFIAFVGGLDKQGIGTLPLVTSFRKYLVGNFKTPPCAPLKALDTGKLPRQIQEFNDKFADRLKVAGLTAISGEEIKNDAKGALPVEDEPPRWNSKESSDLLLALQQLPEMPRESPSIEAKYREYILRLSGWSNQSQPEIEFFHQKSLLYFGLIGRLPPSALRTSVLMDFVGFLELNSSQQVDKVDWSFYTKRLLLSSTQPAERSAVINALVGSGDPVLSLYGRLESWKDGHKGSQGTAFTISAH